MHPLLEYLIKVIICSAVLSGYYFLALRNERFHYWNRFYLLAAWCISLVVPLIKWPVYVKPQPTGMVYVLSELPWNQPRQTGWWETYFTFSNFLSGIAILVIIGLLFHFARSVWQIIQLHRRNPVTKFGDIDLVHTREDSAPFSFFNWLFWRWDLDMESSTGQNMLKHELTHIHEKHSLDKVFAEILVRVFWMNPVFWWMRKELYAIHEFIADSKSIQGRDGHAFATMILQASSPSKGQAFVNPLFHSQLKRRLTMITTSKKPRFSYLRRITGLVFMTATILFTVLSIQKSIAQNIRSSETKVADKEKSVNKPDVIEIRKHGDKDENIQSVIIANSITGIGSLQPDTPDTKISIRTTEGKEPLYIVDLAPATSQELQKIPPAQIESMNVYKNGDDMVKVYGEKGKNGVIIITTKIGYEASQKLMKSNAPSQQKSVITNGNAATGKSDNYLDKLEGDVTGVNVDSNRKISIREKDTSSIGKALYIVDGKEMTRYELDAIPPASIKSITVLKDKSAIVKYGDKGKKGVILVELKKDDDQLPAIKNAEEFEKIFDETEVAPQFPGGVDAWRKFLVENLRYPSKAQDNATQGAVNVQFVVSSEGKIRNIQALNNPGNGLAQEAVRMLEISPDWVPATQNARNVDARIIQKITFRLE